MPASRFVKPEADADQGLGLVAFRVFGVVCCCHGVALFQPAPIVFEGLVANGAILSRR